MCRKIARNHVKMLVAVSGFSSQRRCLAAYVTFEMASDRRIVLGPRPLQLANITDLEGFFRFVAPEGSQIVEFRCKDGRGDCIYTSCFNYMTWRGDLIAASLRLNAATDAAGETGAPGVCTDAGSRTWPWT